MRRVLLDKQVFVAAYRGDPLSRKVRQLLSDTAVERLVSTASLLEIAIKNSIGKIQVNEGQISQAAQDLAVTILPVTRNMPYACSGSRRIIAIHLTAPSSPLPSSSPYRCLLGTLSFAIMRV